MESVRNVKADWKTEVLSLGAVPRAGRRVWADGPEQKTGYPRVRRWEEGWGAHRNEVTVVAGRGEFGEERACLS